MNISVSYRAKWRLKDHLKYQWTECKKLINCNTGREIKRTLHGLSAGYWINKNFIKLQGIKDNIELIPVNDLLF